MQNIDPDEDRQTEILVVAWVMTGLAVLTVGVKLFARVRIVHVVGWDDFFIFFSLVRNQGAQDPFGSVIDVLQILSIIASSFVHYGVHLGFGRHSSVVLAESGTEQLFKTAKFQIFGYPFNIGAFSFPNISITILVCQLLDPNPRRTFLLYAMAILQVGFAIVTIVLALSQCRPREKLWEKTLPGVCWSPDVLNYFSYWFCAYTTLTDVVLAIVPVRAFSRLQMPRSTKLGLCIMMGMTMLSAIVTVVKGTYLPLFTDSEDPLFNPVPLVLWGLIEQNIVIMAACVPTMRPLFHKGWRGNSRSGTSEIVSNDPFSTSDTIARSRTTHRRVGSLIDIALNDRDDRGDAASHESQQCIVRTVEMSLEWKTHRDSDAARNEELIVPTAIAESQR